MLTNLLLIITVHKWYGLKYILRSHRLLFISLFVTYTEHLWGAEHFRQTLQSLRCCSQGHFMSQKQLLRWTGLLPHAHKSPFSQDHPKKSDHIFLNISFDGLISYSDLFSWSFNLVISPQKFSDFYLFPYTDNRWFKSEKLFLSLNDDSLDF